MTSNNLVRQSYILFFQLEAVQLLRNALGGGGGEGLPGVTLCDRGKGSAERYVTPKKYICIIYTTFLLLSMFFIHIHSCIIINMYIIVIV